MCSTRNGSGRPSQFAPCQRIAVYAWPHSGRITIFASQAMAAAIIFIVMWRCHSTLPDSMPKFVAS